MRERTMDDREKQALRALAAMVDQYLQEYDGLIDSHAMSAGEQAIEALAEYGYIEKVIMGRIFGRWTDAGNALFASR
jgi:hypothetical protein